MTAVGQWLPLVSACSASTTARWCYSSLYPTSVDDAAANQATVSLMVNTVIFVNLR